MIDDDTPTWAQPAATPPPAARPGDPAPTGLLVAAALVMAAAAAETVHVARRDELVVGLRVFLVLVVLTQVVLAVLTARRSAGAALGLLVFQATTVLAAVGGGFGQLRVALAVVATAVIVLVARCLKSFPVPELPPIDPNRA